MTTPTQASIDPVGVEECVALLATQHLGRLAYVVDGEPRILPLNYALYQGSVVFRTGYGDLLDAVHRSEVAFEVDDTPSAHEGWSVIVQGVAEEIWRPEELAGVRELPLRPWAPGDRDHYVRILSTSVTGRHIT